jgi:hypothetical protein
MAKMQGRRMRDSAKPLPIGSSIPVSLNSTSLSLGLSVAGLLLCLGSIFGLTHGLCVTDGCQVYRGFGFLGLSLHVYGAVAFGVAFVLSIFSRTLYRRFLTVCLWAEIILLAYQVAYLPCSECLVVGLIWGMLALLEMRESIPVKIWSTVFLVALVLMGKEMLRPWPVYGNSDAPVKVFFSPSCPACRTEIAKLLVAGATEPSHVAFFPVALSDEDFHRVNLFQHVLDNTWNIDRAFQSCWSGNDQVKVGWQRWLEVRLGLARNELILARMGFRKIPLVISGFVNSGKDEGAGDCDLGRNHDCAEAPGGISLLSTK